MRELKEATGDVWEKCQELIKENDGIEKAVRYLCENNLSKGEVAVTIKKILDISLADAMNIVHCSKAWDDR